jgi:hypothetical protein
LVKFPFLANYMTRLGGIVACRENAEWVLDNDELLGFFPEGIRGAFSLYRDAYKLKKFGRDEFVRMALRNRAPIVPFVTLGSAETFPILGKIEWRWFRRRTDWPFLPIVAVEVAHALPGADAGPSPPSARGGGRPGCRAGDQPRGEGEDGRGAPGDAPEAEVRLLRLDF